MSVLFIYILRRLAKVLGVSLAVVRTNLRKAHFAGLSDTKWPNVYSVIYRNKKNALNRPINPIDCRLGSCTRWKEYRAMPVGSRRISQEFQRRKRPMYTPAALKPVTAATNAKPTQRPNSR